MDEMQTSAERKAGASRLTVKQQIFIGTLLLLGLLLSFFVVHYLDPLSQQSEHAVVLPMNLERGGAICG
jgi:hypothetical protein